MLPEIAGGSSNAGRFFGNTACVVTGARSLHYAAKAEKNWAGKRAPFTFRNRYGHRFVLYPTEYVDAHIFQHDIYEKRFLELLSRRFPAASVALDIGANIGNHAIYLSDTFAQIHAFEPNPVTLARLRANLALNSLESVVRVHGVALGKDSGTFRFRENNDGNLGASGFLAPGETVDALSRELELNVVNGDDYIADLNLRRIDFVKIDVEGWEAPLLEGMTKALAAFRPVVSFEYHGQSAADSDYDRIVATLPGYVFVEARYAPAEASLLKKIAWNLSHLDKPVLARIDRPERRTYENIIAFPDEATLEKFGGTRPPV